MSSLFDDLARTLATPMPRRRALRALGAALAAGAVPALRPSVAAGSTGRSAACPSRTKRCFVAIKNGTHEGGCYYPGLEKCCIGPNLDKVHPNQMSWVCAKDVGCGTAGACERPCPKGAQRCGKECCDRTEECVDGSCERCAANRLCGTKCCEEGTVCRNSNIGLCCDRSWRSCQAGSSGVVKCCPPSETCCLKLNSETAACCGKGQACTNGKCVCKKGTKPCGKECCAKGETCLNGKKCCPKGAKLCGDACCAKGQTCCGDVCCDKNEFCASTIAFSKPKVCCPSSRIIVRASGQPVCCPLGTVPNRDESACCPPGKPGCCDGAGDDPLECLGKTVCVRGVCQQVS